MGFCTAKIQYRREKSIDMVKQMAVLKRERGDIKSSTKNEEQIVKDVML